MAEKYRGSFVSKNSLDAEKNSRRSYLEQELERARNEFESKKKQKELQKQRGETTWMLPSLSKRLKPDEEKTEKSKHRKKKKKYEKKSKKNKKEKKHRKRNSPPESNSSAESSDDWVEKAETEGDNETESYASGHVIRTEQATEQTYQLHEKTQREDWMMSGSFLDAVVSSSESLADKRTKKMEEKKKFMKPVIDELGQHPNELNPYWKNGGSGVPTEKLERGPESTRVGDAGISWVKKAFERAREQAEEQGRNLEDVVAERWGSMEKLNALMRNEERRKRRTDDKETRLGWRSKEAGDGQVGHKWRRSEETRVPSIGDSNERHDEKAKQKCSQESKLDDQPAYSSLKRPDQIEAEKVHEQRASQSKQISLTSTVEQNSPTGSSSESDSNESSYSEDDTRKCPKLTEPLSEKEINEISAKILRAELLGDQELAENLKAKLEAGRQSSVASAPRINKESKRGLTKTEDQEEVVITRTDRHGNLYPLKVSGEEPELRKKKRRKTKAIETHDAKGNRLRYFQEDDATDLKAMVEEERLTTTEDHQMAVMSRLTKKLGGAVSDHYTLDDMFETSSAASQSQGVKDEKAKKKAITEQQKAMAKQANCRFCFDHPDVAKHLIISIASHVYLALPITSSLTEGHCLIIPMQHALAATFLDENVIEEVMKFKSSLVKMFKEKNQDVIFLETIKNLKYQNHMFMECVPVPIDVGDVAPIYFKKAIEESESEWAQNQKLVEISKGKGIRSAIPKGLPYFSVEFGMDGGFAHVIEDERLFQHYFGKEIIGGILDLEPMKWRRPPKESFQQHKRKVLNFSEMWEPFDWTRDL